MYAICNFKKRSVKFIILFLLSILVNSCNNQELKTNIVIQNKIKTREKIIYCDSIYPNKNYKISLRFYSDEKSYDTIDKNSVFVFSKNENGKYREIKRDTIESHFGRYQFVDFSGDGIKDILIENISDVRSNLTYYLYLLDLKNDKLTKIKNFNEIKNPKYLPKYDLIDNEVMSGREWTSFYQIKKDTIFDFGYVIYKGMNEDGTIVDFEKEYKETLKKVLNNKNYR